ncbi:MAG: alpha/beta fold hydrolase [Dehalococcoidia bacterium]
MWTSRVGSGPPVVAVHGGPGLWDYLDIFDEALSDVATVVHYDQRGGGRSSRVGPYSVEQFVADLEAVREHYGYERWSLAGHSWGATLALAYAWQHPERVEKLLYISGVGLGSAWNAVYHAEADTRLLPEQNARLAELRSRTRDAEEEIEFLCLGWARDYANREDGVRESHRMASDGFLVSYDCNAALNAETKTWDEAELMGRCMTVDAPVLILHGACDPRPSWATDSMLECLPFVDRIIFEDAGHYIWAEKRDDFSAVVREFIGSNDDA